MTALTCSLTSHSLNCSRAFVIDANDLPQQELIIKQRNGAKVTKRHDIRPRRTSGQSPTRACELDRKSP